MRPIRIGGDVDDAHRQTEYDYSLILPDIPVFQYLFLDTCFGRFTSTGMQPMLAAIMPGRMFHNIQALRAVAALMVVGHHFGNTLKLFGLPETVILAGASGVDIFFVISGFIMVHSITAKPVGPETFLLNRFVRVAPLYWLVTIFLGLAALALPGMFRTISALPSEILKSLFFIPYVNGFGSVTPVVHVGWTLNYEMFFYVIFSLALLLFGNRNISIVVSTSIFLISFVAIGSLAQSRDIILRFYTDPIIVEFAFGMILSLLWNRLRAIGRAGAVAILVAGFLLIFANGVMAYIFPRPVAWGIPAFLIVSGALALENRRTVAGNKFVQLLGASSYALYLLHPLILAACSRVMPITDDGLLSCFKLATILCINIAASIVVHKLVEVPVSRAIRNTLSNARRATVKSEA